MYIPVQDDPMCRGMVIWSENSHSNPLLLEYLAKRSADESFSLEQFCRDRYGSLAEPMRKLWNLTKAAFACNSWVFGTERPYQGICCNHFCLLGYFAAMRNKKPAELYSECSRKYEQLEVPEAFFEQAAILARRVLPEMVLRDLIDLVRSGLMCRITREICLQTMKITGRYPEKPDGTRLYDLIATTGKLLAAVPEFSLLDTLDRMRRTAKLNTHAEQTLKSNSENSYCRSYIHELYAGIYEPEAFCLREHLAGLKAGEYPGAEYLRNQAEKIREHFYKVPLSGWKHSEESPAEIICRLPEMLNSFRS